MATIKKKIAQSPQQGRPADMRSQPFEINFNSRGLGRLSAPDSRDKNYLLSNRLDVRALMIAPLPKERLWDQDAWWGDQGATPMCTAYAWTAYLLDHVRPQFPSGVWYSPTPDEIGAFYKEEQRRDPWPGEDYDGTTVRAGAEVIVAHDQGESYFWAFDAATIRATVALKGPLVIGIDWWNSMFEPDRRGQIRVVEESGLAGGHALVLNGFQHSRNGDHLYRLKNSWGRGWGQSGNCWIRERELRKLVQADSEFCYIDRKKSS